MIVLVINTSLGPNNYLNNTTGNRVNCFRVKLIENVSYVYNRALKTIMVRWFSQISWY